MSYKNNATLTRREIMRKVVSLMLSDQLESQIDRIPLEMRPRKQQPLRCCVHKDRAVIRVKTLPILGISANYDDEYTPLISYVKQALQRTEVNEKNLLSVVTEACSSCKNANYLVTNLCQACEGRYCELNCPKNAISMQNGKAFIDDKLCVNCGLCQKACPFHAIVYHPVPCEESCPVDAIQKDIEGHAVIDEDKCIYCGKCMTSCPYGAIMEKSHLLDFHKSVKEGKDVIALVAPVIAGQFQESFSTIVEAMKKIGFHDVIEVAEGADICAQNEAAEWEEKMIEQEPLLTSSCCKAYTELVDKKLPNLSQYVSHTETPLKITADIVAKQNPNSTIVFIGPCVSKKYESLQLDNVDLMLSTEELGILFIANEIELSSFNQKKQLNDISEEARGFAVSGGVSKAVISKLKNTDLEMKAELVDGIDKKTVKRLQRIKPSKYDFNFIEVMACEGGCVNGCNNIASPRIAKKQILNKKNYN